METSSYKILKYLWPPDMREPAIIAGCCIIQNVIIGAIIHVVVAVWASLYCIEYSVY